jgi:hypothetical protein
MAHMIVAGGVQMLRSQYFAGVKEENLYPTVPRPSFAFEAKIDGTLNDVAKHHPHLKQCLFNNIKLCEGCGKPCAVTFLVCNGCGKSLKDTPLSESENVFTAFLLGVKLAEKGFPYTISLRRESEHVLVFDDMLSMSPCHLNGIPRKYHIPDWRYLLLAPKASLELLDLMEAELWEATKVFLQNAEFRKAVYRPGTTDEQIQKNVIKCFNYPPSQYHLHLQWIVPPMLPFHHLLAETGHHMTEGRAFPMSYVRKVLGLNISYPVQKDTPIEDIIEFFAKQGVNYTTEWKDWYENVGLQSTLEFQNWNSDNFQYVVQGGKAYEFTIRNNKVTLLREALGVKPTELQAVDKLRLQNYGRPYNQGKPTGTYVQKPLEPVFGPNGYLPWPQLTWGLYAETLKH